jgi:hypothetical protein
VERLQDGTELGSRQRPCKNKALEADDSYARELDVLCPACDDEGVNEAGALGQF